MKNLLFTIFFTAIFSSTVQATVIPIDISFLEIGDDVKVTLSLKDLNNQAFFNPPESFWLTLWEDDLIFDDMLGMVDIKYSDLSISPLSGGGYQSTSFMHTFTNASDASTGFGNDYYLTVTAHVPEPAPLALMLLGLVSLSLFRYRKQSQ